jgi:aldehyde dehydrogenase (NAD+)
MTKNTITVAGVELNTGLFIGNEWVAGRGAPLDSVDPATEQVIATVRPPPPPPPHGSPQIQTATKEDVDDAVAAARHAFENTWGTNVSGQERGQLLFALADQIEKNIDRLAALEVVDAGKPCACEFFLTSPLLPHLPSPSPPHPLYLHRLATQLI